MSNELNVAANDTEEIAAPSIEESTAPVEETQTEDTETEVNTEPNQPVKQDVTQTQAFAQRLKAEKTKAQDEMISNMYGESHGLYTKADYDNAVSQQERDAKIQEEADKQGISEELSRRLRDLEDSNTTTKAEKAEYQRQLAQIAEHESLSKDETFKDYYNENLDAIKETAEKYQVDLNTAMLLSIKDNFKSITEKTTKKVQQDTINNIIKNKNSSVGSLADGINPQSNAIENMSNDEFKIMQERALRGELRQK